jgi:hypothetical protein
MAGLQSIGAIIKHLPGSVIGLLGDPIKMRLS